jgi:hypothetical protein
MAPMTMPKIEDYLGTKFMKKRGTNALGGNLIPDRSNAWDIGSPDHPVKSIYVTDLIVFGTGTGAIGDGGEEGGSSVYLHADGSIPLTGNLSVSGGVTIDGVDLSAHVADPDAHHDRDHNIISASDHDVTGTQWQLVGLSATNTLGILNSTVDATGLTTSHFLRSTATADSGGAGGINLQWLGSSDIRAAANVNITLTPGTAGSVLIPNAKTIRSVTFNPASIPYGGWSIHPRADMGSSSELIINRIIADELRVKIFVADETRVDRGTLYVTKGYGLLSRPFTTPSSIGGTATIYFENSPNVSGGLFSQTYLGSPVTATTGDWIMLQLVDFSEGAYIAWFWGRVYNYVETMPPGGDGSGEYPAGEDPDEPGEQSWTFILKAGDLNVDLPKGAFALNFGIPGQGYIKIDAVSTSFVPAISILVWGLDEDGDPLPISSTAPYGGGGGPNDGAAKNMAHMGRLYNALDNDISPDGWGFFSDNAYLKGLLRTSNTLIDAKGAQIFTPNESDFDAFNVFGFRKDAVTDNPLYAYLQGYWDTSNVKARLIAYDTAETRDSSVFIQSFSGGSNQSLISLHARNLDTDGAFGGALIAMTTTAADSGSMEIWAENVINIRVLGASGGSATHRVNIEGDLVPVADYTYDLGSISGTNKRWRTIYAESIVVDTITSGETLSGQEWEYPGSMKIDANHASDTVVTITNDGAGVASLAVEGAISAGNGLGVTGNISVTGNVDGVDLSAFKTAYDTHAGNATGGSLSGLTEAHHNRSHNIESVDDHVISGETTGHVLRVIDGGANTFGFGTILASVISDLDEAVQDIIGTSAFLPDTSTINWTYNDATPSLIADVIPGGIDHGALADLTASDDHTQYMHITTARTVTASHTLSNGVILGLGSTSTTSVRFVSDPNTGMYSSGADSVSLVAGGNANLVISATAVTTPVYFSAANGSNTAPAYTFSDTDTGMYYAATNNLGFATSGVLRLTIGTAAIVPSLVIMGEDGAVGGAAFSFSSDSNTGMYSAGADVLGFTVGGTQRLSLSTATATFAIAISGTSAVFSGDVSAANLNSTGYVRTGNGSASTPSHSFTNDTDTGMYIVTAGELAFSVNNGLRLGITPTTATLTVAIAGTSAVFSGDVSAANLNATGYVRTGNGLVGTPSHAFTNDIDTGFYLVSDGVIGLSVAGTQRINVSSTVLTSTVLSRGPNGDLTTPAYSFSVDTNSGMYRDVEDVVGIAAGGNNTLTVSIDTVTIDQYIDVGARVRTPLITTVSGDLLISSAATIKVDDGKSFRSETYSPGFIGSGWAIDQGITYTGLSYAEFDNMTIRGSLNVYELMIQQIRATNGNIFVSSTIKVGTVVHLTGTLGAAGSTYTIYSETEDLIAAVDDDLLRAQRWIAGVSDSAINPETYRSDIQVTAVAVDGTNATVTLIAGDAPETGFEYARLGNVTNANRRGGVYLSSDDAGAPYIQVWNGVDSHSDWNTEGVIKAQYGRLDAITGNTNEYGIFAGDATQANTNSWFVVGTTGVRLNRVPIMMYSSGGVKTGEWQEGGNLYLSDLSVDTEADRSFFFNASDGSLRLGKRAAATANLLWSAGVLSLRMSTTAYVTLDTAGEITVGRADSENIFVTSTAVEFRNITTVKGHMTSTEWVLGEVGASLNNVRITTTTIQFRNNTTVNASLSGDTWVLGQVGSGLNNIQITTSALQFRNNTTVNGSLTDNVWVLGQVANNRTRIEVDTTNGFRVIWQNGSGGLTTLSQVDIAGNASFTGNIEAASGEIGGWIIDADSLYSADRIIIKSGGVGTGHIAVGTYTSVPANLAGMAAASITTHVAFWAGNTFALRADAATPFRVYLDGRLFATDATITGTVTATTLTATTAGNIAGFTIGATTLTAAGLALTAGAAGTARIVIGTGASMAGMISPAEAVADTYTIFFAGESYANRDIAPFRVEFGGGLYAAAGTIGGVTLTANRAHGGNGTASLPTYGFSSLNGYGMYYASSGLRFSADSTLSMTLSSAGDLSVIGNISSVLISASTAFRAASGSLATPGFAFTSDTNTGFFYVATQISTSINGTDRLTISGTGIDVAGAVVATGAVSGTTFAASSNGASGAASIGWSTGAGIYKSGTYGVLTGDTSWGILADAAQARIQSGAEATPSLAFHSDPDTGIWMSTTGRLDITSGGSTMFSVLGTAVVAAVKIHAADGGTSGPGYTWSSDSDTGFYKSGVNRIDVAIGGVFAFSMLESGTGAFQFFLSGGDNGASNGSFVSIARNTNATTPAGGNIRFVDKGGTIYYVHADDAGTMRVGTTNPINSADTTNGAIGLQASSLSVKDVIGKVSIEDVLTGIAQGASAVRRFKYKAIKSETKGIKATRPFNGEEFSGIIVDYAPRYGTDKSDENPHGQSLNTINAIGDLMIATDYLIKKVDDHESRISLLERNLA